MSDINGRKSVILKSEKKTGKSTGNYNGNAPSTLMAWMCLIGFFTTPKIKAHYSGQDPVCWRKCEGHDATHGHIFWGCPRLQGSRVHKTMEEIFNRKMLYHFETFILR